MTSKRDALAATLAQTVAHVDPQKITQLMETVVQRQQQGQDTTLVDVMLETGVIDPQQAQELNRQLDQKFRSRIGDFEILKKLGEGGMGAVYKARQISMDRIVALKVLSRELAKNAAFVERFVREARASAKLDHPNVVRGYAVGEADGLHYFAMEFIDGESVQDKLDRDGPLEVREAVRIIRDVALAMSHAERQNMVHRDIKPDNIMVTREGVVKLADLGLAKRLDEDSKLTQTGSGFGTPYYMAPEQAKDAKHVDIRSDIYALGATLYHMLTGSVPFDGDTPMTVLLKKEEGKFRPARLSNPNVPEKLDLVIDKMMAVDPKYRPQTCEELIRLLEATGLVGPSSAGPPTAAPAPAAPGPRTTTAPAAKTKRPTPVPPTAGPAKADTKDVWYLRFTDASGQSAKAVLDTAGVRKLIRENKLGLGAKASRHPNTDFRPLESLIEFQDLMQARLIQAKTERRVGGEGSMAALYDQMQKDYRHKKIMKAAQRWLWRLVILIVLAGAALIGWNIYKDRTRQTAPPAPAPAATPDQP